MADYISTQRAKFSEVLDGRDWEVFDKQATVYVSLTEDAELWRSLPELSPDFISEFTDLLNLITDIKNTAECHCVDDPMASGEVFEGRWRQAFIRRIAQGDVTKLVQVLRKGYSSAIAWDEARLVEGKDLRVSEGYRTVRWVNLDPTKTQTMALSLSAVSYTDKVVNGEKLSGEWHNISVSPSIADDGSGVITMQLAQPEFTLTAYQNALTPKARGVTYYFQVPKDLAQAIITAAKDTGSSATANYGNASGLVDIVVSTRTVTKTEKKDVITAWDCRYKEYTDYYFGLTVAEADAIELTKPPSGWTYKLRKTDNGDGTWDVWVVKREVQYRDAAFQNSQVSGDSCVQTRQQLGLTDETLEPVVSTAGAIISQRVDIKDDCSYDVSTNKDTGYEQTSTLTVASPSGVSTTTEKSAQSSLVDTAASAKGHIKRSTNKDSKYPSRYDTTEVDEVPTDQEAVSVDNSKAFAITKTLHTENHSDLTTPTIAQGTITRQEASPTNAGYQRTVVQTEVSSPQEVGFPSLRSSLSQDYSYVYRNKTAKMDAPEQVQGTTYGVQNNINDDGTYGESLKQSVSVPVEAEFASLHTAFADEGSYQYRNSRSVYNAPAQVQGSTYVAQNDHNDDDTYNIRLKESTSLASISTGTPSDTYESKTDAYDYKFSRTKIDAPSPSKGVVFASRMTRNDDDTYNGDLSYKESKEQRLIFSSMNTLLADETLDIYKNGRATPAVTATHLIGVTEDLRLDLNEDATYDSTRHTRVSRPDYFKFTSVVSPAGTVEESAYRNKVSPLSAGIASTNIGSYRVRIRSNADASYDGDVTYSRPPDNARVVAFTSLHTNLVQVDDTVYEFQRVEIDAPLSPIGTRYQSDNNLQDDGTYRSSLAYRQGVQMDVAQFRAAYSDGKIGYEIQGKNFTAMPAITEEVNTLMSLRVGVNGLGGYDYSLNKDFIRSVPLSSLEGATWAVYDVGYTWRLFYLSSIIKAFRRIRRHQQNFYRTESEAIDAINGGDSDSTKAQVSDFLWKSVRATSEEFYQTYGTA